MKTFQKSFISNSIWAKALPSSLAAILLTLSASIPASAQTYTYTATTVGATDSWAAGTNWSGGTPAPVSAASTTLTFTLLSGVGAGSSIGAGTTTTIDDISGDFEANVINLAGATLSGTGPGGGGAVTVDINSASPSDAIELISNGSQTPVVNMLGAKGGGGGNFTYVINAPLILENDTLFTTPTSATASVVIASALSGPGGLTKSGASQLTLSADNTGYTGNITLSSLNGAAVVQNTPAIGLRASTASLTGNPFGQGSISTNGATIMYLSPSVTGAAVYTGVNATTGTQFNYGGATQLNMVAAASSSISLTLGNASATGSVLNRVGDGVLIITGSNSLGVNALGVNAAGTANTVNLFVNGTAPALNSINHSVNNSIILNDNGSSGTGDFLTYGSKGFTADTAGYTTHAASFTSVNGEIANITGAAVTMTDGGAGAHAAALRIGANDVLTLNGTVTIGDGINPAGVILNGGNTAGTAASTPITGGTLNFGSSEGIIYQFGQGAPATGGTARTIASAITGTNGLSIVNDSNNGSTTIDLASSIATGTVNFEMGSINVDSGADLSTDVISISSGAAVAQNTALSVLGINDPTVGGGGRLTAATGVTALNLTGSGNYSSSANIATTNSEVISKSGSGTQTLSGNIGGGTATVAVSSGTLVLSGTNTYTGGTTVTGGTLLANSASGASATGTKAVTITGTGTLGGSGFFHPTTTTVNSVSLAAGTTLAPGTPGNTDKLTLNSAAGVAGWVGLGGGSGGVKLSFNLNSGLTSSSLAITGAFASEVAGLNSTDSFNFTDLSGGSLTAGLYTLISTDDTTTNPFGTTTTATLAGATITGLNGYTEQLQINGGSGTDYTLQLDITAVVPEPSTWTLMLGGLALLVIWQRRRRSRTFQE